MDSILISTQNSLKLSNLRISTQNNCEQTDPIVKRDCDITFDLNTQEPNIVIFYKHSTSAGDGDRKIIMGSDKILLTNTVIKKTLTSTNILTTANIFTIRHSSNSKLLWIEFIYPVESNFLQCQIIHLFIYFDNFEPNYHTTMNYFNDHWEYNYSPIDLKDMPELNLIEQNNPITISDLTVIHGDIESRNCEVSFGFNGENPYIFFLFKRYVIRAQELSRSITGYDKPCLKGEVEARFSGGWSNICVLFLEFESQQKSNFFGHDYKEIIILFKNKLDFDILYKYFQKYWTQKLKRHSDPCSRQSTDELKIQEASEKCLNQKNPLPTAMCLTKVMNGIKKIFLCNSGED